MATDVGEEKLEAVGGAGDGDGGRGRLLFLLLLFLGVDLDRRGGRDGSGSGGLPDLETGALELARQLRGLLLR